MATLFNAPSVDPAKVTAADVVAILARHDINTSEPAPADFFQAGATYRRNDEFRCLAVGWTDIPPLRLACFRSTWAAVAPGNLAT